MMTSMPIAIGGDMAPAYSLSLAGASITDKINGRLLSLVTHTLGDGGYATALELEVKLSDVEYEEVSS